MMRCLLLLLLLLALVPLSAQPVPLSPYEAAMQAGEAANASSQLTQALNAYRKAVTEAEAVPDHPEWLLKALLKYGDLTTRAGLEGRDQQAEAIYIRALAVAEKAYGTEDVRLQEVLNALGWQQWRLQKIPEAEAQLTRALAITEKALPAEAPALAEARFMLGNFYLERDDVKAIALYRQALAVFEQAFGPAHQRTMRTRLNLGKCFVREKQYTEAEAQYQPVVEVLARTRPGGWEHSEALAMLSATYIAQKQYDKAEPLELQVFAYAEKLMGANSMSMMNYLTRLAKFYQNADMPDKAEPYLQRLITLVTKANNWQPTIADAHEKYAELLVALKRPAEAVKEYQAAAEIYQRWMTSITREHQDTREPMIPKFFHDQIPRYSQFLASYATFLRAQGDNAGADLLTKRAADVDALLKHSIAVYERK